jgi:hypothetical protein
MRGWFEDQSPEHRQFDALMAAVEAPAARLAGIVTAQLRPGDRGAVVEQLRYLANLIEAQSKS